MAVGAAFVDRAGDDRVRQQPRAIGLEARPATADLLDPVGVEQGWRGGAVGYGETIAHGPCRPEVPLEPVVGDAEAFPGALFAIGVGHAFRANGGTYGS